MCRHCSGADGQIVLVPKQNTSAGSLLARDGGASCSPGGLAPMLMQIGVQRMCLPKGMIDKGAFFRALDQKLVCGVKRLSGDQLGEGDGARRNSSTHLSVPMAASGASRSPPPHCFQGGCLSVGAQVPCMAGAKAVSKFEETSDTLPTP